MEEMVVKNCQKIHDIIYWLSLTREVCLYFLLVADRFVLEKSEKVNVWNYYVKIDSILQSFCLRHVCINGLSYLGKETLPKLCKSDTKLRSGIRYHEWNKHQLLHRIQNIRTSLIYNNNLRFLDEVGMSTVFLRSACWDRRWCPSFAVWPTLEPAVGLFLEWEEVSAGSVGWPAFLRIRLMEETEGMVEASQICWAISWQKMGDLGEG